ASPTRRVTLSASTDGPLSLGVERWGNRLSPSSAVPGRLRPPRPAPRRRHLHARTPLSPKASVSGPTPRRAGAWPCWAWRDGPEGAVGSVAAPPPFQALSTSRGEDPGPEPPRCRDPTSRRPLTWVGRSIGPPPTPQGHGRSRGEVRRPL